MVDILKKLYEIIYESRGAGHMQITVQIDIFQPTKFKEFHIWTIG